MAFQTRVTRYGFVNGYLVDEPEGLVLIDTLLGGSARRIRAAAEALRRPIVRILLTHAHGDHIGSLDAVRADWPEAEVCISARDARLLQRDLSPLPGEPPDARIRGSLPGARTVPNRLLEGGERLGSLEVVPAPGHTPGHLAFVDTRDRTLFCGDAYTTFAGVATTAHANWLFPLAVAGTWHRPTALVTARALRDLDPLLLAPGHGRPRSSPRSAMDRAIARGV
jgi:glyoxylase-like metal-dependent hydrolase (beta-lactamase superfamily II)